MTSLFSFSKCAFRYLLCFTCLLLSLHSIGQWQWLNPKPSGYENKKITFVNHQTGFILNGKGDLYKTNNTGASWQLADNFPRAITMNIAYSTGVICGYDGKVYISSDNGNNWNAINTNINDALETINIVSRDTIFLSNGYHNSYFNGNIYRSTDRGKTWTTLHCNIPIHAIKFVNSKLGFVGGPQSTILKTTDGGINWEQKLKSNLVPSEITCMQFIDKDTGFAFREYRELLKTTDGGNTWQSSNAYESMKEMYFVNSTDGYLGGGDGYMFATHDGGATFTSVSLDGGRSGNDIYSLYFISRDTGFAVGLLGRIIKTTNAGLNWSTYDSSTYLPITSVSFGTSNTGYATSWNYIYKTTDKGQNWYTSGLSVGISPSGQSQFSHSRFISADTGFVLSSYPLLIHHTTDGGGNWETVRPVSNNFYYATDMQFIDKKTGFMCVYGGLFSSSAVLQTTDGGMTWIEKTPPALSTSLKHIFYINTDTGFATNYSQILKTSDGSNTWQVIYNGNFTELASIVFTSAHQGFAAQADGHILVTNDSGRNWNFISYQPYSGGIQTLKFYNDRIGYFTSKSFGTAAYGSLYQTIDSGLTWQLKNDITANSIIFTPDSTVVIAGYGGSILSSKLKEGSVDSLQLVKKEAGCGYSISAVVTAIFSRADSISFEITDSLGAIITLPATPSSVNDRRTTVVADADTLNKDSRYQIRVKYFYEGSFTYSKSVPALYAGQINNWLGYYNNAWENPANWSCGTVPDRYSDVIIGPYKSIYPLINSNSICKSLTVQPGATIVIKNGFVLTIAGK